MELMQNVAKQQNSQMNPSSLHAGHPKQTQVEQIQQAEKVQEQKSHDPVHQIQKIDSEKDVEELVKDLNKALNPFNTSLRFGFDNSSEVFYVSVIESQTNRMIRRFPAEEAVSLLPKMQEVTGVLFDTTG
jgi:flagellar protein FlaG